MRKPRAAVRTRFEDAARRSPVSNAEPFNTVLNAERSRLAGARIGWTGDPGAATPNHVVRSPSAERPYEFEEGRANEAQQSVLPIARLGSRAPPAVGVLSCVRDTCRLVPPDCRSQFDNPRAKPRLLAQSGLFLQGDGIRNAR